jgi:hypothetical protein
LERLWVTEALPALAETLAASLHGARFQVYQAGEDGAGPLPFALGQLMDALPALLERKAVASGFPPVPAHPSTPGNGTAASNRL